MATQIVSIPVLMLTDEGSRTPDQITQILSSVKTFGDEALERLNQLLNDGYEIIDRESHTRTVNGVFQGMRMLILYKPDPLPIRKPGTPLSSLEAAAVNVEAFMRD